MSGVADEPTTNFSRTKLVGALIRQARTKAGLKRPAVTALTGIGVTAQHYIESGERKHADGVTRPYGCSTKTLVKLARALNITPTELENVGRSDAAVELLTAHLANGHLDDKAARQLVASLRKLRASLPSFGQLVEWVGTATGDVPQRRAPRDGADG